jgi:hypothetical protein
MSIRIFFMLGISSLALSVFSSEISLKPVMVPLKTSTADLSRVNHDTHFS